MARAKYVVMIHKDEGRQSNRESMQCDGETIMARVNKRKGELL